MNASITRPSNAVSAEEDLAEQARPGHGIPSQDPTRAAQAPLRPDEAEHEAKSVYVGGGTLAGMAAGAAVGVVAGGPVGVVVGGTLGAVAGELGGEAAGALVNAEDSKGVERPVETARRRCDRVGDRASTSRSQTAPRC
jgi:phage tail tape-measure protein